MQQQLLELCEEPVMRPVRDAKWMEAEAFLLMAETPGSQDSQIYGFLAFQMGTKMDDKVKAGC